jgi:hypothetical protein
LKGRLHLPPAGASQRIDEIRILVESGILRACSVGFRPINSAPIADGGGVEYLEQELLECSLVAIGANPNALLEARKLGVSNEVLKMLYPESQNQNQNLTLGERIRQSRASVRRAKAILARTAAPSKPKLLTASDEAKAKAAHIREVHRRPRRCWPTSPSWSRSGTSMQS